jgi:hypothetical protein
MPSLLSSERIEGDVLQAPHLGLQKPQIHERRPTVKLTLGVLGAADQKHRDAAAVAAAHQDALELAATHEAKRPQEDVVRLDHRSSFSGACARCRACGRPPHSLAGAHSPLENRFAVSHIAHRPRQFVEESSVKVGSVKASPALL